jgi:hypothetical protein
MAKHKRTISHGMITPEMERTYSDLAQQHENEVLSAVDSKRSGQSRPSKDGGASFASSTISGMDGDVSPGSSPASARSYEHPSGSTSKRRKSLFKRLIHR